MSKAQNIASLVRTLIEGPITEAGYSLWDVTFAKEGPDDTLFVLLDREGGIGLSDCERVTHLIDPILDEADPIPGSYYLEVSSAGTERELRTAEHFAKYLGRTVCALLYTPIDGSRTLCGTLTAYEDGRVTIGETTLDPRAYSAVRAADEEQM